LVEKESISRNTWFSWIGEMRFGNVQISYDTSGGGSLPQPSESVQPNRHITFIVAEKG